MNIEYIFEKLYEYYNVGNASELSEKIESSQKTISNWKIRNSINAIKKKCRELGIYNEIFGDLNTNVNNSKINIDFKDNSLSKYFIALESVAVATNKENELIDDIKELMKKYIG
jgi:DNA repair ATPase RecN